MASLDSVRQKLYRAKHHFEELESELEVYYRNDPVKLRSTGKPDGSFDIGGEVPARMGLIAGDILQCMRTSLDYLVWELVDAYSGKPNHKNAFPISLTESGYKMLLMKRNRLDGMSPAAIAIIDQLQPYHLPEEKRSVSQLALLDELTNINKHRRVILTTLKRVILADDPLPFPHIASKLTGNVRDGEPHTFVTFGLFVAFNETGIGGREISTSLNVFGDYIGYEILPLFEQFFK